MDNITKTNPSSSSSSITSNTTVIITPPDDDTITTHFTSLLNTALNPTNTPTELIQHLNAVKEALLFQPIGAGEEPLIKFGPELCSLSLLTHENYEVRHFVLHFIEEACKSERASVRGLEKPVEALYLALDQNALQQPPIVTRWAARCATVSWKHALWILAQGGRNQDCTTLHNALFQVVNNARDLILHSQDRQTRIALCRFFEVAGQTFLGKDSSAAKSDVGFESLLDLPMSHPTLKSAKSLEEIGLGFCTLLAQLCTPSQEFDPQVRIAASTAFTKIAKARPAAQPLAIEKFTALANLPDLDMVDKQLLKNNLLTLLKRVVPQDASIPAIQHHQPTTTNSNSNSNNQPSSLLETPIVKSLSDSLTSLGAAKNVESHFGPIQVKKQKMEEMQRLLREYPGQANAFQTEGLANLGPESLARLLVHNAGNVPKSPPPGYRSRANARNPDMGPHGIPMCLERVMNLIRAVETGRGLTLPAPLANAVTRQFDMEETLKQRESAFSRVVDAVLDASKPGSRAGGGGWENRTFEICALIAARLACDVEKTSPNSNTLRNKYVEKLIKRELPTKNLIAANTSQQQQQQPIISFVMPGDSDRIFASAFNILVVEYANDLGREEKVYDEVCLKIVDALGVAKEDKVLGRLLSEIPRVPAPVLQRVLHLSCMMETNMIGLNILRELILSRPSLRNVCISCILRESTVTNLSIRQKAVKLLATLLANNRSTMDFLECMNKIRLFASSTLDSLRKIDSGVGAGNNTTTTTTTTTTDSTSMDIVTEETNVITTPPPPTTTTTNPTSIPVVKFIDPPSWNETEQIMKEEANGFIFPPTLTASTTNPAIVVVVPATATDSLTTTTTPSPTTTPSLTSIVAYITAETARRLDLPVELCKTRDDFVSEVLSCYADVKKSTVIDESAKRYVLQAFHHQTSELWLIFRERLTQLRDRALALFQMFPEGSEDLVLSAVTSFAEKDPDIVCTAVKLLRSSAPGSKPQFEIDARFVIPIIGSLTRDEALAGLTRVAEKLTELDVKRAITNLASGAVGRTIEGSELLLSLTNLNANNKALNAATNALLDNKTLINASALRVYFQEVTDQLELPTATMLVALKALQNFPELKPDILSMIDRLFPRRFWTTGVIWEGFCRIVMKLKPESFALVFDLPEYWFLKFLQMSHVRESEREATKKQTIDMMRNIVERDDIFMGRRLANNNNSGSSSSNNTDGISADDLMEGSGGNMDGQDGSSNSSGDVLPFIRQKRAFTGNMKAALRLKVD
jgi:hypothetical protein